MLLPREATNALKCPFRPDVLDKRASPTRPYRPPNTNSTPPTIPRPGIRTPITSW